MNARMITDMAPNAKPRRRRMQYSLRTLLASLLLFALVLTPVAHRLKQAGERQKRVKAIQSLGGYVGYKPDRLGTLLGLDLPADVEGVSLDVNFGGTGARRVVPNVPPITDKELKKALPNVKVAQ